LMEKEEKERFKRLLKAQKEDELIPMKIEPTARQMERQPPKVGRNEPCGCGSGKKFKKCCQVKE